MRNPERLKLLYEAMSVIHKEKVPDWRFLQLMENFMGWLANDKKIDPFFVEDDEVLELFDQFLAR